MHNTTLLVAFVCAAQAGSALAAPVPAPVPNPLDAPASSRGMVKSQSTPHGLNEITPVSSTGSNSDGEWSARTRDGRRRKAGKRPMEKPETSRRQQSQDLSFHTPATSFTGDTQVGKTFKSSRSKKERQSSRAPAASYTTGVRASASAGRATSRAGASNRLQDTRREQFHTPATSFTDSAQMHSAPLGPTTTPHGRYVPNHDDPEQPIFQPHGRSDARGGSRSSSSGSRSSGSSSYSATPTPPGPHQSPRDRITANEERNFQLARKNYYLAKVGTVVGGIGVVGGTIGVGAAIANTIKNYMPKTKRAFLEVYVPKAPHAE